MKRRTQKEREEILQLKEIVISKLTQHEISAYEIGERVEDVTFPTVLNIVNGKTKYPSMDKLKNIYNYIISTYEIDSEKKEIIESIDLISETISKSKNVNLDEVMDAINQLNTKLTRILDAVQENGLRQQLIFEFLTSAKAEEVKYLKERLSEKLK